jgi:predicted DNA-binding WGR domain protein
MQERRFELVKGTSRKFWAIRVDRNVVTVSFGRIGTAGRRLARTFATTWMSPTEAARRAERDAGGQILAKLRAGYREVSAGAAARPPARARKPRAKAAPARPRAKAAARRGR